MHKEVPEACPHPHTHPDRWHRHHTDLLGERKDSLSHSEPSPRVHNGRLELKRVRIVSPRQYRLLGQATEKHGARGDKEIREVGGGRAGGESRSGRDKTSAITLYGWHWRLQGLTQLLTCCLLSPPSSLHLSTLHPHSKFLLGDLCFLLLLYPTSFVCGWLCVKKKQWWHLLAPHRFLYPSSTGLKLL